MEVEDSRNALFCDPNAYIMGTKKQKEIKKVVFSEPYETAPNYYANNNFTKKECEFCKTKNDNSSTKPCNEKPSKLFDISKLLPMISMFGNGSGGLSNIVNMLGKGSGDGIMSLLSNKEVVNMLLGLFSGKQKQSKSVKADIPTTEFVINNYTRVE